MCNFKIIMNSGTEYIVNENPQQIISSPDIIENRFLKVQDCRNNNGVVVNIDNISSIEPCRYKKYVVTLEGPSDS
ncbi:MAG TPA: hypothetical protein DC034_01895 [Clostridium sp.]|nr:hypothetical protein [Clostridium sp.]